LLTALDIIYMKVSSFSRLVYLEQVKKSQIHLIFGG